MVSLAVAQQDFDIQLALTFDYGQKAAAKEVLASEKICEFYKIKHQVIKLDWLAALLNEDVWVPNRNGLFLNIAGCFAEGKNFSHIIFGANKQEAIDFIDNSAEFVNRINAGFEFSTKSKPIVVAPLLDLDKSSIIKLGLEKKAPLELVYSCYGDNQKNCGECPSCRLLKDALATNQAEEYLKVLF